jgi:hypothetical protein
LSEETIRRANEARQLLANPLLIEAFERVEKEAFEQALAATDPAKRDRALMAVGVTREVEAILEEMITEGEAVVRPRPTAA